MANNGWQSLNTEQKIERLLTEVLRNAGQTIDLRSQTDERFAAVDVKLQMVAQDMAVLNSRTEDETV